MHAKERLTLALGLHDIGRSIAHKVLVGEFSARFRELLLLLSATMLLLVARV